MADCYTNGLMPLAEGLRVLLDKVSSIMDHEQVSLSQAAGRVVAEAISCPINVPPANNSAMDGYGARSADCIGEVTLTCIGQALAGQPYSGTVAAGQCVWIMTGAVIPAGVDAVIMQEDVTREEQQVSLSAAVKQGQNIRLAGEDLQAGQLLFEPGHRIKPADIGLLASLGVATVAVKRKPKVALLSNGDELVEPGQPLAAGQIYESNRYALAAMLKRLSLEVDEFGIIADEPEAIREAFTQASQYDAVISSGGVSVGDADYIKDILSEMGQIDFWKLAIKPGKPFAYGRLGKAHYFGLPGNPVSAMVTCHQLAVPALRQLAGEFAEPPLTVIATTTEAIRKRPGRLDFQRGIVQRGDDGRLVVSTTGRQGSGIMSSISNANCFLVLELERGNIDAGEQVEVLLFDALLG
ncbi:molybdopterin molybdotransferase MoeA [Neiella sp. HB171785]|uniref:Molybdopterin molybdenumtransferase n=1 Tax=Neiella litorisoli TaxID=2771431 RepID=A0A8J6UJ01_9GAMM|nr:molybdopterin molybdotransferase MoeA [Neiella litorisoli]MBD1389598.1 molybdopterin molybdotransferase MoeA [Neiella litorisoli]